MSSPRAELRAIRSDLTRLSARLLTIAPSDVADDYPRHRRILHVLNAIESTEERLKLIAWELRGLQARLANLDTEE